MALAKQLIALPIDKGLDTKLDPKQEEIGFLRKAENVVYETVKLLRKRNGYDQMDLYDLNEDTISNPQTLMRLNDELLLATDTTLYSYSDTRARFVEKGPLYSVTSTIHNVIKDSRTQEQPDTLLVEGFQIFVWKEGSGIRYSVQDTVSRSFIVGNQELAAAGERPVLAHIGGQIYVVYGNSANLLYRRFSILNPTTLSTPATIATNRHTTDGLIDAESCTDRIVVAYNSDNSGNDLAIFTINSDNNVSSIINITSESASDALDVLVDSVSRVVVTYSNGSAVRYLIYPVTLTAQILAPTNIQTVAVTTCCTIEITPGVFKVYYEVPQAGAQNNYIRQASLTTGGTVSNIADFKRSVGLGARAFRYNEKTFVLAVHDSEVQSSYFLFDEDGYLITKIANQTAAGLITYGVLQPTLAASDTSFTTALLFHNRLGGDNGTFFSTDGILSADIEFAPTSKFSNAMLADCLHICSGILKLYDGSTVTEHGFHVFPETLTNPATSTSGGSLTNGTRSYVAVYAWTDNTGKDHRSAPTVTPLSVTLSGGGSTQTSTIRVPTLRVTDKQNAIIELYRTEAAGTTYYKVTSGTSPTLNSTTSDTVDIVDGVSDSTLINNEILYTTGGVLDNIAASNCYQVTVYNGDRLAIVGEDSNRVFFSKQVTEGFPVEFSDAIYRDIEQTYGPVTTLKTMNEKLIAGSPDACYYITGEGPTNTGQQDNLTKPEIISTDIGFLNPEGSVLTPLGIMFQSRKGIWLMGPGLQLQYLGGRVEAYNAQTVTSAQVVGQLNQIRFTLSESRTLVYNYNLDRWATFENHGALSAITIKNDYYYLREDGALWKENRTSFSDAGSPIKMRVETGWLSLVELQGFQRAYHMMILGTYKSAHKMLVKVAYDFVESLFQEELIDTADFIDASPYGSDPVYGASSPYGGTGNLLQARVDFERQKCQAIKIRFEDQQNSVGEGLTLSGITIRAGAKAGSNKLPAAQKFGTSS